MKKIYSLMLALFAMVSVAAQSAGIFENYAILQIGGTGNNTFYDLGSSTSNPDFQGANLGTFATSGSLIVAGGQNKIYKCNGGDITGGTFYYRVFKSGTNPGSLAFTSLPMTWVSDDTGAGTGCQNQTWQGTTGTTNIISGLAPDTYTIQAYTSAGTNLAGGVITSDNNGNYWTATFTVTTTLAVADVNSVSNQSVVSEGMLYTPKKGNLNVTVYDFSGRVLKTMNVKGDGNAIDLNVPQSGLYMVKVSNGTEQEVVKFAK